MQLTIFTVKVIPTYILFIQVTVAYVFNCTKDLIFFFSNSESLFSDKYLDSTCIYKVTLIHLVIINVLCPLCICPHSSGHAWPQDNERVKT